MRKVLFIFLIIIIFLMNGCLKDNLIDPIPGMNPSAEMLVYFETNGDFINSTSCPAYIKASEVYQNLDNYLILDIRDKLSFVRGHIPNSKNVQEKDLIDFVETYKDSNYKKIVIVCETGQRAAFASSILRLDGFNNVYSLQWGMASWHQDFSNDWYKLVKNSFLVGKYEFYNYPKPDFNELPYLEPSGKTTKDFIISKSKLILQEGFDNAKVDIDDIMKTYNSTTKTLDYFVVCYAPSRLYNIRDNGHPPTTVRYEPNSDLRSTTYLQTLPTNKKIAVYDDTGEISAYVVAYLKMLGYDAYAIIHGANGMIGEDQKISTRIIRLKQSDIMNYPYVTGD